MHALDEDVRRMLAFCEGDTAAFDALFRRWSAPLLRYLERMLRDAGAAEELVQEVFLRVYRARPSYRPEARFSTWLYRIATNLALNELRRPRRRAPHASVEDESVEPLVAGGTASDELAEARRDVAAVDRALAAISERQRAALWLVAVEGLAYAEVADTLEISEQAVKALVHRARVSLAEQLSLHDGRQPGGQEEAS